MRAPSRQRGYTLTELGLALTVVLMLGAGAVSLYRTWEWNAELSITGQNARSVLKALRQYHAAHCREAAPTPPTMALLVSEGWLPPAARYNRVGPEFTVALVPPAGTGATRAEVRGIIDGVTDAVNLTGPLGADGVVGNQAIWTAPALLDEDGIRQTKYLKIYEPAGGCA